MGLNTWPPRVADLTGLNLESWGAPCKQHLGGAKGSRREEQAGTGGKRGNWSLGRATVPPSQGSALSAPGSSMGNLDESRKGGRETLQAPGSSISLFWTGLPFAFIYFFSRVPNIERNGSLGRMQTRPLFSPPWQCWSPQVCLYCHSFVVMGSWV